MAKKNRLQLIVALGLCLVSMIFSAALQTDWGKVEIIDVTIETDYGTLTGYLYRPDVATTDHPMPGVVASHGYLNNREMQDCNWVELARRGYVVFAMNAYGHGDSSVVDAAYADVANVASGGMIDAVEYLATLAFVDVENIGVTGHSMGGGFTDTTMAYYTALEREALLQGATTAEAHAQNKVKAGVIVGNYPRDLYAEGNTEGYLSDLYVIAAKYDEFFGEDANDLLTSDETKQVYLAQIGEPLVGDLVDGQIYTNTANGYRLGMWNPRQFHATNHFSTVVVGDLLTAFETSMPSGSTLSAANQVWWVRAVFTLFGLVGFFLVIIPLADGLLKREFFTELRQPPTVLPALQGVEKKKFIRRNVVSSLICFLLIVPMMLVGYLLMINAFWPQDTTGGIGLWGVGCGLIALWFLRIAAGGKLKDRWVEYGVKIGWRKFLKTALLALFVVFLAYLLVFTADYLFQTDFRFWSFDIRVFSAAKIWVALKYVPLYAIYYTFNSVAVSRMTYENWSERKQMAIAGLFNAFAPALLLVLTYLPTPIFQETLWNALLPGGSLLTSGLALIPILMIPFVPILAIAAFIDVRAYRLTGSPWLGALVNTFLITMITVANTSFSFPY